MPEAYFSSELFRFLAELTDNNNRDWFAANKQRYEAVVRDPFLRLIADFAPELKSISPHFVADPRPTGGSMFRIYRDTRFSNDKSPYKTHVAAHFPHALASKESSSPGFYLSLSLEGCYGGAGLWHPDPGSLGRVRDAIVLRSDDWGKVRGILNNAHERLSKPPKGYDPSHPFIEDLKNKDFVTGTSFIEEEVCAPNFLKSFAAACKNASPLVHFLTTAVGLPW